MDVLNHPILRPKRKLLSRSPSQVTRLEYINKLFDGFDDWKIRIDMRCRRFVEDLVYQRTDMTGGKEKKKIYDPKLGIKYEKYGHLSDCFDMVCCLFLDKSWKKFNSRTGPGVVGVPGSTIVYGVFDY